MCVCSNQTWCSLNLLGAFECCCLLCAVCGELDDSSKCYQGISSKGNVTDVIREVTRCASIKNKTPQGTWHYISLLYCKKRESDCLNMVAMGCMVLPIAVSLH